MHTLAVQLSRVVDLSSLDDLARLHLDLQSTADDYTPCQLVGGAIAYLNFEGVMVPSLRRAGAVNLVIYTTNLGADSHILLSESRDL